MKYAFENLITFSRGSQASYFNSAGQMTIAAAGEPRFDYDPVTLQPRGFLIEEQRTNRILNSAAPITQNVTVSNQPNTLSFYGTGTVTLSGAHTATVTGTGAFPTRTNLLFTPAAGTLTVTISGDVQYMNLGPGAFATSWIPTLGAQATRLADSAKIDGANFAAFYKQSEGTLMAEFDVTGFANPSFPFVAGAFGDIATDNLIVANTNTGASIYSYAESKKGNVTQIGLFGATNQSFGVNSVRKLAFAFRQNDSSFVTQGGAVQTDNLCEIPSVNKIILGSNGLGQNFLNGHIRRIMYIPKRLSNTELQALTI